jgi:hypothetical protein
MHTSKILTLCALGLAAAAAFSPPISAQETDRRVRVERLLRCEEGQDCAKRSQQILVTPEGQVELLRGDGDGNSLFWLGEPGELAREALAGLMWSRGAFLGVQLTDLTPELRQHFGVPEDQGVLVASVVEDSPAARAGVEVGDILTRLDDELVSSGGSLARAVGKREPGPVQLELWRDGRIETLTAMLEKPADQPRRAARVLVRCDGEECEEGSDRPSMFFFQGAPGSHGNFDFDCETSEDGDAKKCAIEVRCEDDTCTCTVNGEERVCDELDGVKTMRLHRRQVQ